MQGDAQAGHHEVTNMTLNFSGVGSHPRLFEALAAMLSRNALNPADISTLHKLYSDPNPPPASYLHVPQLLGELLVVLKVQLSLIKRKPLLAFTGNV